MIQPNKTKEDYTNMFLKHKFLIILRIHNKRKYPMQGQQLCCLHATLNCSELNNTTQGHCDVTYIVLFYIVYIALCHGERVSFTNCKDAPIFVKKTNS